jgi:hypothetical protein
MPRNSKRMGRLLAIAALAVIAGCGKHPTAPTTAEEGVYASPTFARVPAPPRGMFGATSEGPLSASVEIDGSQGGELTVGRFQVVIPAGSFEGTSTVSITVPDQTVVSCELEIAAPVESTAGVTLVADCEGVTNVELEDCGTLSFDAAADVWRTVDGSVVDIQASTVAAPVRTQAKIYGVAQLLGRAGW